MKVQSLGDICQMVTDGTHYTPKDVGAGIPFLTVKDMSTEGLDFSGCSYISEADFHAAKAGNSSPQIGDVLFSKDGTVGKVHVVFDKRDFAVLSSIAILRPNASLVDSPYLGQMLRTPKVLEQAADRKTGSAIRRIILADLRKIRIPLPSLNEQRRIAAILDQAEALRAKRRKALVKLDTLTQSLFLEMFGELKGASGRTMQKLGDHLTFVTSGGRGWAKYYSNAGARFIRSLDVQMNYISSSDCAYVIPPENAEARRTRVDDGDVLLTITGSRIGRVTSVGKEMAGAYISQHVAILRPKKTVNPIYLSYFLSMGNGGQRQIAQSQYGQTKPGLNFEQIERFEIPLPTIKQQEEFVERLCAIQGLRDCAESSSSQNSNLFLSLQHRAFRGEL